MELIKIGKIVNTHGIKGELRILSDFDKKELVFKPGFNVYIGLNYIKETINTYRKHKMFDMITLNGYNNINDVLKYKDNNVYINKEDLHLSDDEYILDDLINMEILDNNENMGIVVDYINNNNVLLKVQGKKEYYIPLVDEYVIKIDVKNKQIIAKNVKDLIL